MPPSADDLPGKSSRGRSRKRDGKHKPGKQPGAPGMYLAWQQDPGQPGTCSRRAPARAAGLADAETSVSTPTSSSTRPGSRPSPSTTSTWWRAAAARVHVADAPPGAGMAAGHGDLRPEPPGVVRVPDGHAPRPRRAVRAHHRLMSGNRPSDGWVHGLLARAAKAVAAANEMIRALIVTARVICGDETPVRSGPGPKTRKKYLQVACTSLLTCYFLGGRDLPSFMDFIYRGLHGTVVVHDRYVNYDPVQGIVHQLCCSHILRDIEDAAECYPDAIWPGQIAESLRALIHAANTARDRGLAAVPLDETTAETLKLFRHGVLAGLSGISRVPGAKASSRPPGCCWNASSTARPTYCGSSPTPPSRPPPTRQNATCAPQRPSRRSAAGSARTKPPATVTPSAATSPPPANTEKTPSTPSAPPSPAPPGCHPPRPLPAEP